MQPCGEAKFGGLLCAGRALWAAGCSLLTAINPISYFVAALSCEAVLWLSSLTYVLPTLLPGYFTEQFALQPSVPMQGKGTCSPVPKPLLSSSARSLLKQ